MDLLFILLVLGAIVCFLLATFGVLTRINVGWLGLALAGIAWLIGSWPGTGG